MPLIPQPPHSFNEQADPGSLLDASRRFHSVVLGGGGGAGSTIKHHTERAVLDPMGTIPAQHKSETYSSALALGHELGHAWAAQQGSMPYQVRSGDKFAEEKRNIGAANRYQPGGQLTENSLRKDTNEYFKGSGVVTTIPQRTHHSGRKIE